MDGDQVTQQADIHAWGSQDERYIVNLGDGAKATIICPPKLTEEQHKKLVRFVKDYVA